MAFVEPQVAEGSWEDLIPTISFDGEISYEGSVLPITDPSDRSWMQLISCRYERGGETYIHPDIVKDALMTAMSEEDDLGIYLNDSMMSSEGTPRSQNRSKSSGTNVSPMSCSSSSTNVSPVSCASSGVFSSSDFEALSPLSFGNPASPGVFCADEVTEHRSGINGVSSERQSAHDVTYPHQWTSMPQSYSQNIPQSSSPISPVTGSPQFQQILPRDEPAEPQQPGKPSKVKPPMSYIALIAKAILSQPSHKALLFDIYKFSIENYEYYRTAPKTWKNAIRHNLSVNECFIKNGRAPNGRGYYWSVHPACVPNFRKGDYRRREARQLAVDMDKLQKQVTSNTSYTYSV